MKILAFVHEDYEDLELQYPKYRMMEEGYTVDIAGPEKGKIYKGKHGYPCKSDLSFKEVKQNAYEALIIPGGFAPDKLRRDEHVLDLTRFLFKKEKIIAFICHAGWVPISAHIIRGMKCTSTAAIKDDLMNAGGIWVDEPVVVDRNMISSRNPNDLPYFCKAILKSLPAKLESSR